MNHDPDLESSGSGWIILLIIIIVIILISLAVATLIWKNQCNDDGPVPVYEAIPLTSYSKGCFMPIETKWIEKSDYRAFNPNGIRLYKDLSEGDGKGDGRLTVSCQSRNGGRGLSDPQNREKLLVEKNVVANPHHKKIHPANQQFVKNIPYQVVVTLRASNNKHSYPLLQIFDPGLNQIILSGKVEVDDPKPVVSPWKPRGYEDMRVFSWEGAIGADELAPSPSSVMDHSVGRFTGLPNGLYLVGVNVDRNVDGLPSMVLARLKDLGANLQNEIRTEKVLHLTYKPLAKKPNKNWSPITLESNKSEISYGKLVQTRQRMLGFVINIDPLLVVGFDPKTGICYSTHEYKKQLNVTNMRNSTITYHWREIPEEFQKIFDGIRREKDTYTPPDKRYLMMGHTKYVESGRKFSRLILYRHYFVVIDLTVGTVHASNPFYLEQSTNPHIEYISGLVFGEGVKGKEIPSDSQDSSKSSVTIMYGLKDYDSKYVTLTSQELQKLMAQSDAMKYPSF